jgi:hypothetical protein
VLGSRVARKSSRTASGISISSTEATCRNGLARGGYYIPAGERLRSCNYPIHPALSLKEVALSQGIVVSDILKRQNSVACPRCKSAMQEITRIVFPLGNDPGLIAYERPPWRTSSSSLHSMLAVSANVLLKPSVLSGPFRTSACPGLRPSLILLTLERCAWAKGSARMLSHPGGPVRREG